MESLSKKQVEQMNKALSNSVLFQDFNEDILMMIFSNLNVITISTLIGVCKKFKFIIWKRTEDFPFFDSVNMIGNLPNIYILKILQRFSNIRIFKCHAKVTTSELSRFLEIIKKTVVEFQ